MTNTFTTEYEIPNGSPESTALESSSSPELRTLSLDELAISAKTELYNLRSPNYTYLWASDSPNFKYAFFGRDTETVVEHLAISPEYHEQCCTWLVTLAQHQGQKTNTKTDERLGAFPHEIRSLFMDGIEVDQNAKDLFQTLRPRWSDDPETDTIVYYGELDGPARFIRACVALANNGVDLSEVTFTHTSGETRSLLDACDLAAVYIQERRDESDINLVELQPPENLETLTNQTLKDSIPAYFHNINGTPKLANRTAARAPLEAQLVSYEALIAHAGLVDPSDPQKATYLRQSANTLKANVLHHFLINGTYPGSEGSRTYLAAMLDRDPSDGAVRKLNIRMSDAAEGMNGEFFKGNDLATIELRQDITRTIMSDDFLTDSGIRCRALSDHGAFDFAEYHGALTNWVVLTHSIAKGQLEQGYARIASELWTRMLSAIQVSGTFKEFFYVDEQGSLLLPDGQYRNTTDLILRAEEHSQDNQAWTISAVIEAIEIMKSLSMDGSQSSNHDFEDEILGGIQQYRDRPNELINKLKQNARVYHLEQVTQLAGAHEVDLTAVSKGSEIIRRAA